MKHGIFRPPNYHVLLSWSFWQPRSTSSFHVWRRVTRPLQSWKSCERVVRRTHQVRTQIIAAYRKKFGLDQPIHRAVCPLPLFNTLRFDLGLFDKLLPAEGRDGAVSQPCPGRSACWHVATRDIICLRDLHFGALMAWPRAPGFLQIGFVPISSCSYPPCPIIFLGLILVYVYTRFRTAKLLPLGGAYTSGTVPVLSLNLDFILDVIRHGTLPALSIVLAGLLASGH